MILGKVDVSNQRISLRVDERATERELASSFVVGHKVNDDAETGYLIEFIGPGGKVLESSRSSQASYSVTNSQSYVRAKISFTRRSQLGSENFYAWMQPVFTDGRKHDS